MGTLSRVLVNSDADKHQRIIDSAVKVFARNGFHRSKIAEIAREAGVASGTIYLYFRNKDDILISVFEESLDRIIKRMETELEGVDEPEEMLKRFISCHLSLLDRHQELAEILQVELRQSHRFMKEYEPTRWIEYMNIIASILKKGQERGDFRDDISPGIFKRTVFGALDEISLHWIVTAKDTAYLDNAAEQIADIILAGARSPGACGLAAGAEAEAEADAPGARALEGR